MEAALVAVLLAFRDLHDHVAAVAGGLRVDLESGRAAVSRIVGRDPNALDEAAIGRASIESLAENASDGVVAPAFWFLVFGLPGICAYKAINTLDSMIGHRNDRYEDFGKVAARLDDGVNWIPARLTAVLISAACAVIPTASPRGAWRAIRLTAGGHRSPNAGWPEAAVAGGLGIRLAGPRRYGEEIYPGAWIGEGRADLRPDDIDAALRLYRVAGLVAVGLLVLGTGLGRLLPI